MRLLSIVSVTLSIVALFLIRRTYLNPPTAATALSLHQQQWKDDKEGTYEKEGLWGVVRRVAPMGFVTFISFALTMTLFPTFIPLGAYEEKQKYLVGRNKDHDVGGHDAEVDVLVVRPPNTSGSLSYKCDN